MQGSSLHDARHVDKKQILYIARCTKISDVCVSGVQENYTDFSAWEETYCNRCIWTEFHESKIDYIQLIENCKQKFFIGSTTGELHQRLKEHYCYRNSPIHKCNSTINFVCNVPCTCRSKTVLEITRNKAINKYYKCVNMNVKLKHGN